jgi:hypothetical protein
MPGKRPPHPSDHSLSPQTTIATLAKHSLIDTLTGPQLVVYIKLLGARQEQRTRKVSILNSQLQRDARTAVRALRELENMGLVKIRYEDGTRIGRTIEV